MNFIITDYLMTTLTLMAYLTCRSPTGVSRTRSRFIRSACTTGNGSAASGCGIATRARRPACATSSTPRRSAVPVSSARRRAPAARASRTCTAPGRPRPARRQGSPPSRLCHPQPASNPNISNNYNN